MSNNPSNVISDIGSTSFIIKPLKVGSKPTPNKFKCSQSESKLKITSRGIKEKIVSKVRSWSSREKLQLNDKVEIDTHLSKNQRGEDIESESMENIADSNLSRARGSLENLLKDELAPTKEEFKSRSTSSATGSVPKSIPESPKSSPDTSKGAAKLLWDPFDKKGRKNRKEQGRKKKNKKHVEQPKQECSNMPVEGKSCLSKPPAPPEDKENAEDVEASEDYSYEYKYKYFPKNSKSVVFTNEVFVVYFNDNDIYESKEPLKKDVEQQERNKEMRQGHLLRTQEKYNLCLY